MTANMIRNISQISAFERKVKEENDRRVKTAQVNHIRNLLKSGNGSARKYVCQRNLKSAIHYRTFSISWRNNDKIISVFYVFSFNNFYTMK